jgi:hypothetical protein
MGVLSVGDRMPKTRYEQLLGNSARMLVEFEVDHGDVVRFVVKLERSIAERWIELQRYDCYHGCVHKDVLRIGVGKVRTVRFEFLDPAAGLNTAIRDFQENFRQYIGRSRHGNRT